MKGLFGLLLLLSMVFFVFMRWGGELTGAAKNGQTLPGLNAEKIKLLEMPQPKSMTASAMPPVQLVQVVSSAVAITIPLPTLAAISAPLPISAPVAASVPVPKQAEKKAETKTCMEWGEFSGTDLALAETNLAGLKLGERLAHRTVTYESGYWVYIPPLKNQAAVTKKIKQIKDRGVEDFFVVQEPPQWINTISLGVFKTQEAAKNFHLSLKKKGIRTAKVGERKGKLKFTVFVIKQVDTESGAKLAALQKDFANSELKAVACK